MIVIRFKLAFSTVERLEHTCHDVSKVAAGLYSCKLFFLKFYSRAVKSGISCSQKCVKCFTHFNWYVFPSEPAGSMLTVYFLLLAIVWLMHAVKCWCLFHRCWISYWRRHCHSLSGSSGSLQCTTSGFVIVVYCSADTFCSYFHLLFWSYPRLDQVGGVQVTLGWWSILYTSPSPLCLESYVMSATVVVNRPMKWKWKPVNCMCQFYSVSVFLRMNL